MPTGFKPDLKVGPETIRSRTSHHSSKSPCFWEISLCFLKNFIRTFKSFLDVTSEYPFFPNFLNTLTSPTSVDPFPLRITSPVFPILCRPFSPLLDRGEGKTGGGNSDGEKSLRGGGKTGGGVIRRGEKGEGGLPPASGGF